MPVDNRFGNDIVAAFSQGKADRAAKETKVKDEAFRQQQLEQQRELEEQRLEQDQQQFNARHSFEKQIQEIQGLIAKQGIAEKYSQTGIAPPDSEVTKPTGSLKPDETTLNTDSVEIDHPVLGKITSLTPEGRARQNAKVADIEQGPLLERARKAEEAKAKLAIDLENLKSKNDIEEKKRSDAEAYRRAIDVANIRAAAAGKATRDPSDRPFSPKVQKEDFGLDKFDPTLTPRTAGDKGLVTKLTPLQLNEIGALDDIEDQATLIKGLIDNPEYAKYFEGGSGFISDIGTKIRGGETDPVKSQLAVALGKLQQVIALADFGKVIPATEKDILKGYAPTADHRQTLQSAKDKVENLINHAQKLKANAYKLEANPTVNKSGSPNNSTKPKAGGVIYFNEKGEEITPPANEVKPVEESFLDKIHGGKQTIADRHLNPLNIKLGPNTKKYLDSGVAEKGEPAQDGGTFLKFKSEAAGFGAAFELLNSGTYSDLPLNEAMKKWSGGGYGAEVLPGADGNTKVKDLKLNQKLDLVKAMAKREGYSE